MFYTDMQHVHQNRTLKPRYARTQATPQSVRLDPSFEVGTFGDVYPGTVLSITGTGVATPSDGTTAPAGLCGTWFAPVFGIDEVTPKSGERDIAMWVLGNDAIFEVHAPAFNASGDWVTAQTLLEDGNAVYLKANSKGLLTPQVTAAAGETAAKASEADADSVVRFLGMEGTNVILVAGL